MIIGCPRCKGAGGFRNRVSMGENKGTCPSVSVCPVCGGAGRLDSQRYRSLSEGRFVFESLEREALNGRSESRSKAGDVSRMREYV